MVKLSNAKQINWLGHTYAVSGLSYKGNIVPIILDLNDYVQIEKFDKNWHVNDKGMVVTSHKIVQNGVDIVREIYIHDLVLKINGSYTSAPTLHINRLGIDNRKSNLMPDILEKDTTKNIKKKDRIINLSGSGILSNDLPSYVWYLKECDSHGERFMINVGDVKWKSTSSKQLSLRYKLEETKKYLRFLKGVRPDLFTDYSMNGDLNEEGKNKLKSFISIAKLAGFNNINNITDKTDYYLKEKHTGLSKSEISILQSFNPQ
jgi:hypothetical protein